jgi:anti-sigma B factor antagonist
MLEMKLCPNNKHPCELLSGKERCDPRGRERPCFDGRFPKHMNPDAHAFHIASEQHGEESFAKLAGSVTIDSSPELRRVLLRTLKQQDCRRLTLDFSDVVYIDTSGLAVLMEILRSAKQLGKSVQLSGLRDRPRYLVESTGLLRFFDEVATKQ